MTTLTVNTNNLLKGKFQVQVSDDTQLTGRGISKCKYVGDLNVYMITRKTIETLKGKFNVVENSKW